MANPWKLLRQRAAARVARLVDFRIDDRMRGRLDEQDRRLAALEAGMEQFRGDLRWTSNEVERIIPHVAAQEAQLEDLRVKLVMAPSAEEREVADARSLIEEVQRQHAQIRVRLSGIAMYEDRLRKLEERANGNRD